MLTQTELLTQLAVPTGKKRVLMLSAMLREQQFSLRDVVDATFDADKHIAFRASWLLENMLITDAATYAPELPYLLEQFTRVSYPSCQRHYANIIIRLTSTKTKTVKETLAHINFEPVVEKLFNWLIDPEVLVAVKSSAAEALLNLSTRYPWIKDELPEQLEFLMRNGTAAIQARGKKILKKLKRP